jgi:hypothetical protein
VYVLNQPCGFLDPLGLAHCDLNVGIKNKLGLDPDTISAIQQRINALLGATTSTGQPGGDTIGANFDFSGKADYNVIVRNSLFFIPRFELGTTPRFGISSWVWVDNIMRGVTGTRTSALVGRMVGTVAAHELAHLIGRIPEEPYPGMSGPNLMNAPDNPNSKSDMLRTPAPVIPQSLRLTPGQISTLFSICTEKQKKHSSGNGGGSAGNEFGFDEWLLGWLENMGGGGGSGERPIEDDD